MDHRATPSGSSDYQLSRLPSFWMVTGVVDTAALLPSQRVLLIWSLPVDTFLARSWGDRWHNTSNLKARLSRWKSWISQKNRGMMDNERFTAFVTDWTQLCYLIAAISLFVCEQRPTWVARLCTLIVATWLQCCQEQAAAKVAGRPIKNCCNHYCSGQHSNK